jgi:hypothetical protein
MIRIPVQVIQGTSAETSAHQLRRLPDGRSGVLIDGMVFPVDAAGMVNLEGQSFYPRNCPPALDLPEEFLRMAERTAALNCRIEVPQHAYPILHLDGSDGQLSDVVAALQAQGIQVDCFGAAYRAADNGQQYAWFIRLKDSSIDPWKVASCLGHQELSGRATALDPRMIELGARLARTDDALANAEAALSEQNTRHQQSLDTISVQAAMLRAAMEAQRERADAESTARHKLAKEVENLATQLTKSRSGIDNTETVRQLEQQLNEALAGWLDADASTKAAEIARREAEEQLEKLQEALAQAQTDRPVSPPKGRRNRQADLESSFLLLLPNLIFVRDSLRFTAEQVFDLRALLTQLARLNTSQIDLLEGKKLRDANNWWESHFSTGQGRDGRLYYRQTNRNPISAYQVLLSDKLAQSRDLDWLRRN